MANRRKLRPAIEIVSDIGSLGFDLQHHSDAQIVEAVKLLRTVNPELFAWLVQVLGSKRSEPAGRSEASEQAEAQRLWPSESRGEAARRVPEEAK